VSSRAFAVAVLGLGLSLAGCSKKEEAKKEKVTAKATEPKKEPKAKPKPKVDEDLVRLAKVVKTEEDFETTVQKDIVLDNLEQRVDALEQELTPAEE
jgi:protein involved in sex pheromone biosynthesis